MFERRLKVFLGVLILVTLTLVLRAAQVQVLQHKDWEKRAIDAMKRSEQIETRRGAIRDYQGRVMAMTSRASTPASTTARSWPTPPTTG